MTNDDESETAYDLYGPRERRVNRFFWLAVVSVALTGCFIAARLLSEDKPVETKRNNNNNYVKILCVDKKMRAGQKHELCKKIFKSNSLILSL